MNYTKNKNNILKYQCPICLENIGDNKELEITSCGHIFCNSCLKKWECKSNRCPVCRSFYISCNPTKFWFKFNSPTYLTNLDERIKFIKENFKKVKEYNIDVLDKNIIYFKLICQKKIESLKNERVIECNFDKTDEKIEFYENKLFKNGSIEKTKINGVKMTQYDSCQFDNVVFTGSFSHNIFTNCIFKNCKFSNATFYGDYTFFDELCKFIGKIHFIGCITETVLNWTSVTSSNNKKLFADIMKLRGMKNIGLIF